MFVVLIRIRQNTDRYFASRWVLKERSKKVRRLRFCGKNAKSSHQAEGPDSTFIMLDGAKLDEEVWPVSSLYHVDVVANCRFRKVMNSCQRILKSLFSGGQEITIPD